MNFRRNEFDGLLFASDIEEKQVFRVLELSVYTKSTYIRTWWHLDNRSASDDEINSDATEVPKFRSGYCKRVRYIGNKKIIDTIKKKGYITIEQETARYQKF